MSYQNYSAFLQAKEESRRQMSKEMSQLSVEIDEMVSNISKTKASMTPDSCTTTMKTTATVDVSLDGLQLPGFNPVC